MQLRNSCYFLSKTAGNNLLQAVKIPFVIKISLGIGLTDSSFLIIFHRLLSVPQSVITHAQLQKRNIIIAIRQNKSAGILIFRRIQRSFIPIDRIAEILSFQKMFSDFTTQFSPRHIKTHAAQKCVQRQLLLSHLVITIGADRTCLNFIFNPSFL